jgi:hypothetical protein
VVYEIDVAPDLLRAGRFGGPSPGPGILPARWSVLLYPVMCCVLPVLALLLWPVIVWRRRRAFERILAVTRGKVT